MDSTLPLSDRLIAALFLPVMSFGFLLIFGFVGSSGLSDFWQHVLALSDRQCLYLAIIFLLLSALGFYLGTFKAFRIQSYGTGGGNGGSSGPISMGMARLIFFGATVLSVVVFVNGP